MNQNTTRPTGDDVAALLAAIADPRRRADAEEVCAMMARASGESPRIWSGNMVGFGTYRYRYESGREGEWFLTGFASRAAALTLNIMPGFTHEQALMERLGKHKTGKSCLHIKRLADVKATVLEELVAHSVAYMRATDETGARAGLSRGDESSVMLHPELCGHPAVLSKQELGRSGRRAE